jgi:DNA-binding protein HU-beta
VREESLALTASHWVSLANRNQGKKNSRRYRAVKLFLGTAIIQAHAVPYLKGRVSTRSQLTMNKSELIDQIAISADISKASAGRALNAVIEAVTATLKKGGEVSLVGFGAFYVAKREARTGRNPRTGATVRIEAARVPKFRAGKALKDTVN